MFKDISGIILSGGSSSRMGTDKALLVINGQTIIERITNLISSLFENILIITNSPDEYRFLNIPLYEDIYKNKGPLAGIHSGLFNSHTKINFVVSCDTPLITKDMINYLINYKSDKPVRYFTDFLYEHPLVGVYSRKLLPHIENVFNSMDDASINKEKNYSIKNFLKNFDHEIIQVENLPFYSKEMFFNVNLPTDLLKFTEYLNSI
ncbi:MAG: molybdenum cofactor guanylyltransferase [Ignavibacteriaceae bacterium]